jgi:hypothetical protein
MKARIITLVSTIVLGIVFLILLILDLNNAFDQSESIYKKNQSILADALMDNAINQATNNNTELQELITYEIMSSYPTSSSMYCILAKNDEIVFLKDENTSSTLNGEKLSSYFDEDLISIRDQKAYIVSFTEVEYNNDQYTLAVCTKKEYLEKKSNFDVLRLHSLVYFAGYSIALVIINILFSYSLRTKEKRIKKLELEAKNNRLVIETLENDKNRNYVNSERADDFSFYRKEILEEVIAGMTLPEKEACIQIDIFVENLKMDHFIQITTILNRIKVGQSISSYWEENQFKVLLFHHKKEEVQRFIDLFLSKYKIESQENVGELKIVASRLVLANDEGGQE